MIIVNRIDKLLNYKFFRKDNKKRNRHKAGKRFKYVL